MSIIRTGCVNASRLAFAMGLAALLASCGHTDTSDRFCLSGPDGTAVVTFDDGVVDVKAIASSNGAVRSLAKGTYKTEGDKLLVTDDEGRTDTVRIVDKDTLAFEPADAENNDVVYHRCKKGEGE